MFRAQTIPIVALTLLASIAGSAQAYRIDHNLAGAGTSTPYSELVDAIPTAWDVYVNRTPLSDPTSSTRESALPLGMDLAENSSSGMLGQVVRIGHPNGASRHVWGVVDRLSAIATPVVLYYHGGSLPVEPVMPYQRSIDYSPQIGSHIGIRGNGPSSRSGSTSGTLLATFHEAPETVTAVLEPSSIFLILTGAGALVARRRR